MQGDHSIECREVAYGSDAYKSCVALRYRVLREPLGLFYSPAQLEQESAEHHLAAYRGEKLVACLIIKPAQHGEAVVRQVAVAPERQGQGIGRILLEFAENLARQKGFHFIRLHSRETAVPFYERLGYERIGSRFEEITLPHWEMTKRLKQPK